MRSYKFNCPAVQKFPKSFIFIHTMNLGNYDSFLNPPTNIYTQFTLSEGLMEVRASVDLYGTDVITMLVQLSGVCQRLLPKLFSGP